MISIRFTCSIMSLIYAALFSLVVITGIATNTTTTSAADTSSTTGANRHTFEEASTDPLSLLQVQEDRPIEQTRKNIQVLKQVRESQLFLLMHFITASLDTKCNHCHVQTDQKDKDGREIWAWESDANPKKVIARQCMKMMLEINRTNFGGETAVTCYTCHRASTVPARVFPLPPRDPVRKETTALPAAEQILAKYFAAIGGKDAVAKLKTAVMKGTIERSEGRNAQLDVTWKQPDKYLVTQTTPRGASALVVNGQEAWVKTSAGSRKLSGMDLEMSKRAADVNYAIIKVVNQPAQMKVLGTEKIGDREAYVVALADPDKTIKFFFDTQTGLLLRQLTLTRTMLVPLPDQVDFEDYRDVDGVKLPFTIRTSNTATYDTATRRLTEIKHNVAVDDNVFNLTATPR